MAGNSITLYSQTERLAPVTGAKQAAPSVGYGEGIGESMAQAGNALSGYAKGKDAYQARVDEAGVMELDAKFGEAAREIEQSYLTQQGRNAIDARAKAEEDWMKLATDFQGLASNPRQQAMMAGQLRARRDRWVSRSDAHLTRETEVWQVGVEDASIAELTRDVISMPVGSTERTSAILQMGARLDDVKRRRGWSEEQRRDAGFTAFSGVHLATTQMLRDEDPEAALEYLEEHRDQIEPEKFTTLFGQVQEDAWTFTATKDIRGFLAGQPNDETVEVTTDGQPRTLAVVPPVSASIGSRFGPRRSPGGVGSSNHKGVDYPVPVNTPVVASLPGVVRLKNDPDGYGQYIEIDHGNGTSTRYAHLSGFQVRDGARVEQGQTIALSGGARGAPGSGNSQGPHVHYEFLRNGQQVDPAGVVGQEASVGGRVARPSGQSFMTEDDVLEYAAERAGGNLRLQAVYERIGLQELGRRRGARADNESEANRRADEWRAQNPDAPFSAAPASIRSSVSPSYRASEAVREQNEREADENSAANLSRDTVFNALLDEAVADPAAFMSRDLEAYRGVLTAGQYNALRGDRRQIATANPTGGRTVDQTLASVSGVVTSYLRQIDIPEPSKRTPEQAQTAAEVNLYVRNFVAAYQADPRNNGQPPTPAQLAGAIRLSTINVRRSDGEVVPLASAQGQNVAYVIPRRERQDIVARLQRDGIRNPTTEQVNRAYRLLVQNGELEPPGR